MLCVRYENWNARKKYRFHLYVSDFDCDFLNDKRKSTQKYKSNSIERITNLKIKTNFEVNRKQKQKYKMSGYHPDLSTNIENSR